MKKIKYCAALFAALTFAACGDDPNPDPDVHPDSNTEASAGSHLDIFTQIAGTGATGDYVARVDDPANSAQTINVTGKGVEVTEKLTRRDLVKGGYYYAATVRQDGLAKFKVTATQVITVAECPYGKIAFAKSAANHSITVAHDWIDDHTLIIMQYSSATKKHIWGKYDTDRMKLLDEGELDLHAVYPEAYKFSTSGHIRYRASDGKLLYFTSIIKKGEGVTSSGSPITVKGPLAIVTFDEKTMRMERTLEDDRVFGLSLESYGDTHQEKAYFDRNGDLYLIALKKGSEYGAVRGTIPDCVMVRVRNGETDTDRSYLYTPAEDINILIVRYLSPGKGLFYVGDHARYYNGARGDRKNYIDDSYYYAIYDNEARTMTRLKMDGADLPWSTGGLANYMARIGDTYYLGINAIPTHGVEDYRANVYSMDVKTERVSKSFDISGDLSFQRMFSVANTPD